MVMFQFARSQCLRTSQIIKSEPIDLQESVKEETTHHSDDVYRWKTKPPRNVSPTETIVKEEPHEFENSDRRKSSSGEKRKDGFIYIENCGEDQDNLELKASNIMQNLIIKQNYIQNYEFMSSAKVNKFEKIIKIGEGKLGEVFRAHEKNGLSILVTMKKVLVDDEGFPMPALREIRILHLLKHENIVNLLDIRTVKSNYPSTSLVFEFCEHNLAGLLSNKNVKFGLGEIKKVLQQLLNALQYIHSKTILHRDIKPENILITNAGIVKLANFGLARSISVTTYDGTHADADRVVSLWYHPPELLLGDRNYGSPVDLWGVGCVMAGCVIAHGHGTTWWNQ